MWYVVDKETCHLNCCCATCSWYWRRTWGVNCVMHLGLFVRRKSYGVIIPHGEFLVSLITHLYLILPYNLRGEKLWYRVQYRNRSVLRTGFTQYLIHQRTCLNVSWYLRLMDQLPIVARTSIGSRSNNYPFVGLSIFGGQSTRSVALWHCERIFFMARHTRKYRWKVVSVIFLFFFLSTVIRVMMACTWYGGGVTQPTQRPKTN